MPEDDITLKAHQKAPVMLAMKHAINYAGLALFLLLTRNI